MSARSYALACPSDRISAPFAAPVMWVAVINGRTHYQRAQFAYMARAAIALNAGVDPQSIVVAPWGQPA